MTFSKEEKVVPLSSFSFISLQIRELIDRVINEMIREVVVKPITRSSSCPFPSMRERRRDDRHDEDDEEVKEESLLSSVENNREIMRISSLSPSLSSSSPLPSGLVVAAEKRR